MGLEEEEGKEGEEGSNKQRREAATETNLPPMSRLRHPEHGEMLWLVARNKRRQTMNSCERLQQNGKASTDDCEHAGVSL